MNSKKLRALAALLREALKSVTISHSTSGPIQPSAYKQIVSRNRSTYDPNLRLHVYHYDIEIQNGPIAEANLELLRNELREVICDDKVFSASFAIFGGVAGSPIEIVLKKLMKEAIVTGPENAARLFYASIARGYLVFQDYYLLPGMKIAKEMQVLDGISLIPLSDSAADLPHYLPLAFTQSPWEFLSKTLLRVDVSVSPILREPPECHAPVMGLGEGFRITVHSTEIEDFYPEKFFQALTFVGGQSVQAAMTWRHLSDDEIFDLSLGTSSGYSRSLAGLVAPTEFSEEQIRQALGLYFKIVGLPTDVLNQLTIPIDRWMKSKTQQGYVDKLIDLGIAFESFFLRGIIHELTFRFSLRGSLYLGEGLKERSRLKKELQQFYVLRSRAVHEGTLPDEVKVDGQTMRVGQFIEGSQELFKQSLLKAIESRQLPDWSTIELGGDQDADDDSVQPAPCPLSDTDHS